MATKAAPKQRKKDGRAKNGSGEAWAGDNNPNAPINVLRRELQKKIEVLEKELAAEREREAARQANIPQQESGEITAAMMRKVLGQAQVLDEGPMQVKLRAWLESDMKGYLAALEKRALAESGWEEKEAELESLRDEVKELRAAVGAGTKRDEDVHKLVGLIDEILETMR